MKIDIPKGKYILAVSGGVDSMTLLHILLQKSHSRQSSVVSRQSQKNTNDYGLRTNDSSSLELVVGHFNHGIRADSAKDARLVEETARQYGLELELGNAKLGANASEETARKARYDFLEKLRAKHKAKAIITAHHRDDMVETALLNVLRGTKRRGLTAIADNPKIIRPLLKYKKKDILSYAKTHKLKWREDSTNKDERYLRNFLRPRVAKLPTKKINDFSRQLEKTLRINRRIDKEIAIISQLLIKNNQIVRQDFVRLPADVGREVVQHWLKQAGLAQADKKLIDKSSNFIKTAKPGTKLRLGPKHELRNSASVTTLWIA